MTLPYNLSFAGKTVKAEVELTFVDKSGQNLVKKLGYIKVFDPDLGDLTYPASATLSPSSAPHRTGGGTTRPGNGAGAPPASPND